MSLRRILVLALVASACRASDGGVVRLSEDQPAQRHDGEAPVALNAESPVSYPPALFEQGIEGRVLLRLYVDTAGNVVTDSTRIQESSGYPALDSAAVQAAPRLRFSPAMRNGSPVPALFIQPIQFRHPSGGTAP